MRRTVRKRPALFPALGLGIIALLGSAGADAHFRLVAPANWMMQSTDGSPQKTGPCGNEAPQTPSNVTTPFRPGDTVTIQLNETVYHPGHYRVALAVNSPNELPPEPTVTPGTTACGSVPIQQTPVFPILADGMLAHTSPFTGQQSFQVKLPSDVTCTSCTLQIIEFMAEHGAPCFYHHCAKISIQADGGAGPVDGGGDASRDAAGGAGGSSGAGGAAGTSTTGGAGGTSVTGGAAGAGANGGAAGTGATGGATGTGATGGATGSGGATGTGATGGATGTGATGSGATGGTSSGGSTGSGGGGTAGTTGGASGRGGTDSSAVTGGCTCSTVRTDAQWAGAASVCLAFALAGVRRRRRHL
jgi:hypothetical protein